MLENQLDYTHKLQTAGAINTFAKIEGKTQKLGQASIAVVYLFNPTSQEIQQAQTDSKGNYCFKGLIKNQIYSVFARDIEQKYNAVIQDNIIAK